MLLQWGYSFLYAYSSQLKGQDGSSFVSSADGYMGALRIASRCEVLCKQFNRKMLYLACNLYFLTSLKEEFLLQILFLTSFRSVILLSTTNSFGFCLTVSCGCGAWTGLSVVFIISLILRVLMSSSTISVIAGHRLGLKLDTIMSLIKIKFDLQPMKPQQTAIQRMQEISQRLISNTPELAKFLDNDSILKKTDKKGQKKEVFPKGEMTSNDYYDKCRELMTELATSKDKVSKLENDLEVYKQRFVEREIEYRKIIEELQDQLRNKVSMDGSERVRMQQIFDLHSRIQDNITSIQTKTSKILVQQQSDIIKFFHKKINEIKEKFKEERISKGEKDEEYLQKEKQLVSELDWIKNIAQKIDNENQTMLKKYNDLKSEFEIQQNDREVIVKELILKKKKNAVLSGQLEQYEKALQELSKQHEDSVEEKQGHSVVSSRIQESYDQSKAINTINTLKSTLLKQQKKVKQYKGLYVEQIQNKTELQKILRQIVDGIKSETIQLKIEGKRRREEQGISKETRDKILEKLMNHEKILNLIYDKTFYPESKKMGDLGLKDLSLE